MRNINEPKVDKVSSRQKADLVIPEVGCPTIRRIADAGADTSKNECQVVTRAAVPSTSGMAPASESVAKGFFHSPTRKVQVNLTYYHAPRN